LTAYALYWTPKEVTIASDTLIYTALNEPLSFRDKVIPLPRLRAAYFSRGVDQIGISAMATLALRYDLVAIEDVAAALPQILGEVTERVADETSIYNPEELLLYEGNLVGWSPAEQKMCFWAYRNYAGYGAQRLGDDELRSLLGGYSGFIACPALPAELLPQIRGLSPERGLIELMKAQRRKGETMEGAPKIGGEIQLTAVNSAGVATRVVHRFEDYEVDRHAGAAVVGRIERGEHPIDYNEAIHHVAEGFNVRPGDADAPQLLAGQQLKSQPVEGPAGPVETLSRAQRRRLAQEERKAAKRQRVA
jgi:hypothetical protein